MVSCDTLEVFPAAGCLILGNGRLRNFESEVILGYAIECVIENIGRHVALAYDAIDSVTSFKCAVLNGFYTFRKYQTFYTSTIIESLLTNALHTFRKFNDSH